MPSNSAAWRHGAKQRLQVSPAPYPRPGPDEIVVKNRAIAVNPIDWILRDQGTAMAFPWIRYPFVFGSDVAGEVVEAGRRVRRFRAGDRVVGYALGVDDRVNSAAHGAFQLYSVLLERTTAAVPDGVSFASAAVLPMGLATAAGGLFERDQLGLRFPQQPKTTASPPTTGKKTVLIWGGSTSVGLNAIQLAVAAGYEVFTTCSPKNFELVKSLGASQAFDYRDAGAVGKIVRAMDGRTTAGAISLGQDSAFFCLDVLGKCQGDRRLAMGTAPVPQGLKRFVLLQTIFYFATSMVSIAIKSRLRGIKTSFIWGTSLAHSPVGDAIFLDFLPEALAQEKFRFVPEPLVVGQGLEAIEGALDLQKKGVSAKKLVVTLE
ncbi:oxidoreductase [Xylariaceae sp. FL0804]|nr:oxidoreductase [Xylariaceae sp. FL0804]